MYNLNNNFSKLPNNNWRPEKKPMSDRDIQIAQLKALTTIKNILVTFAVLFGVCVAVAIINILFSI